MKQYIVYKHTTPSNKVYIGITSWNPSKRFSNGKGYKQNEYFTYAIKKYGWTNITHEILYTNLTLEEAESIEKTLIQQYQSTNRLYGYNIQIGGIAIKKHSNESKIKISNSRKGKSPWNKGISPSPEVKLKMSESAKKKIVSNETREKLRAIMQNRTPPMLGKKMSFEVRKKLSEIRRNITDETRQKMSIAQSKRIHPENIRVKISQNVKGKPKTIKTIITCPHCKKECGGSGTSRWHFNRCKSKPFAIDMGFVKTFDEVINTINK